MKSACEAHDRLREIKDKDIQGFLATHCVIAYWRPFTENYGAGRIQWDYPNYPANEPEAIQKAHGRIEKIRNKFCAHSSAEGFKVLIVPAGFKDPDSGEVHDYPNWVFGRRSFANMEFLEVLHTAAWHFAEVLIRDIRLLLRESYSEPSFKVPFQLTTCFDEFDAQL